MDWAGISNYMLDDSCSSCTHVKEKLEHMKAIEERDMMH